MQGVEGRALLDQFGIDTEDPATILVLDRGLILTQSDASIHVMAAIGGLWRLAVATQRDPASLAR